MVSCAMWLQEEVGEGLLHKAGLGYLWGALMGSTGPGLSRVLGSQAEPALGSLAWK